ncbi:ankyrin repeat protein [Megavirus baoshan]|uniref:Putative ankyrin repeat protein n=1 Tax=Megavirus baoshan TaxID=2496520 RepID=A0A3S8UWG9_9VIRU|nr:ankyrin repeat protein [Megavirus baoshan]AZL89166.1 ankyrin repeat protein [Megavirus baoshan]
MEKYYLLSNFSLYDNSWENNNNQCIFSSTFKYLFFNPKTITNDIKSMHVSRVSFCDGFIEKIVGNKYDFAKQVNSIDLIDKINIIHFSYNIYEFLDTFVNENNENNVNDENNDNIGTIIIWIYKNLHFDFIKYMHENYPEFMIKNKHIIYFGLNIGINLFNDYQIEIINIIIKYLCDHGLNFYQYNMLISIVIKLETVIYCIDAFKNNNKWTSDLYLSAGYNGRIDIIEYMINMNIHDPFYNSRILAMSCGRNDIKMIEFMLQNGVDAQTNENAAIFNISKTNISQHDKINRFKLLMEYGANLFMRNNIIFFDAVSFGYIEIVKFCIDHGIDVTIQNNRAIKLASESSSYCCCSNEASLDVVKLLVENGADIHIEQEYVLKKAIKVNNIELVKYLLEQGANYTYCRKYVGQFEKENKYHKMIEFLSCQNN